MNFQDIHELLRLELLRRIEQGRITGAALARQAGFQQAHISNFLSSRRALSLEGLDRVLAAQNLTIEQLLPVDLAAAGATDPVAQEMEQVPVVSPEMAASNAHVADADLLEIAYVPATTLASQRARALPSRSSWTRFVALRLDAQMAAPLQPLLPEGSLVVLDRHYTSAATVRPQRPSLFAVRVGQGLTLGYVELRQGSMIVRPHAREYPVELIRLQPHENHADHIVGRVCFSQVEF